MLSSSLIKSASQFSRTAAQASLKSGLKFGPAVNTDFARLQSRSFHATKPVQGPIAAIITAATTMGVCSTFPLGLIGTGVTASVGALSTLAMIEEENNNVFGEVVLGVVCTVFVGAVGLVCSSSDVSDARIKAETDAKAAVTAQVDLERDAFADVVAAKVIKQLDSRNQTPVDKA